MINKTTFTNLTSIAARFNIYFTKIDPNLTKQITQPIKTFNEHIDRYDKIPHDATEHAASINELKDPFFSLKSNKISG